MTHCMGGFCGVSHDDETGDERVNGRHLRCVWQCAWERGEGGMMMQGQEPDFDYSS